MDLTFRSTCRGQSSEASFNSTGQLFTTRHHLRSRGLGSAAENKSTFANLSRKRIIADCLARYSSSSVDGAFRSNYLSQTTPQEAMLPRLCCDEWIRTPLPWLLDRMSHPTEQMCLSSRARESARLAEFPH